MLKVIRTREEADRHDHTHPALVLLPGRWVRCVVWLRDHLLDSGPAGKMVRSIELILTGCSERESALITMGVGDAVKAAAKLARTPDQVLAEVVEEETRQTRRGVYVLEIDDQIALEAGSRTRHRGDSDPEDC